MEQLVFKRCGWCEILIQYKDDEEPLNPYLIALGFKKSTGNTVYHNDCFNKKYPGYTKEELEESYKISREAIKLTIEGCEA